MIACLCAFIGNTNRNQLKETENKQDLLARDVVGALISSYWAHGWLEVPEIKWLIITNSIHSAQFSEGLVPRLPSKTHGTSTILTKYANIALER